MKGFKKDGKFRPTGNKSKSSLKKSDITRNQVIRNKSTWEAKLEEPSQEQGTTTHTFELGDKATEHEVKNALMRMTLPDGSFRYYEQDVNPPYLHYIKKVSSDENFGQKYNDLPSKTKDIAIDWWVAISEGNLAGDIMSVSGVYPSTVEGYQGGDPIAFDEFTDEEKMKLINRAGGENGMIEKIADEWQLDEEEVIQRYG